MIKTLFSGGQDPLKKINWVQRAVIPQGKKTPITVTMPDFWSMNACTVFASHYLRVVQGVQETSAEQAIRRVTEQYAAWALQGNYLDAAGAENFKHELAAMLVHQKMSPNSPAWYNLGVVSKPQGSACFIAHCPDDMKSIIEHQALETRVFCGGSGLGCNLDTLRPANWLLSSGGSASGPTSFMRALDGWAGVTKSGGKTRRAAKLVCLDVTHPDTFDFIEDKATAERMASDLIDAGWSGDWNGIVYTWLPFQNANNSIRVSDAFMKAVFADQDWTFTWKGEAVRTVKARDVWHRACVAAWTCGDPGVIFDDTTNRWHTSPGGGKIRAANPCIEFCFIDDSACNLASLNLRKFDRADGTIDAEALEHAVAVTILAQEVTVSNASYPSEKIAANSEAYRPLGLGYSNLGALLMERGLAYDSEEGRAFAAALTSFIGAAAQTMSAQIAAVKGPYQGYLDKAENRQAVANVMRMHLESASELVRDLDVAALEGKGRHHETYGLAFLSAAIWKGVAAVGPTGELQHPPRNAQTTLIAPTGTISFMMDCDTTGIEPSFALIAYKDLASGGMLKIAVDTVGPALRRLGYPEVQVTEIVDYINRTEKIEGAPGLLPEHLPIFDCASICALTVKPPLTPGERFLAPEAHIRMLGAVQPFLSGAISKTINAPANITPEQIGDLYALAWRLGLKSVAVYRDTCKRSQPLRGAAAERPINQKHPHVRRTLDAVGAKLGLKAGASLEDVLAALDRPRPNERRRLPAEVESQRKKFSIGAHEGYFHVGFYPGTRQVGEIFFRMSKEGSTVSGLLDAWATMFSLALQWGAPLEALCRKGIGTSYPPQGFTGDEQRSASSIIDYVCRFLLDRYCAAPAVESHGVPSPTVESHGVPALAPSTSHVPQMLGPDCPVETCGGTTQRAGSCWICSRCGGTTGCG